MTDFDVEAILAAVGGADNVVLVEPCVTRLRFEVAEPRRVEFARLKPPLCYGATMMGTAVQVIVGPGAERVMDRLQDRLGERSTEGRH